MRAIALAVPTTLAVLAVGCGSENGDANGSPGAGAASNGAASEMARSASAKGAGAENGGDAAASRKARRPGKVVKVVDSQFGRVIADGKGEAFYLFDREKTKRPRCFGACARAWPPVLTKGKPRAGKGARARLLGTTRRPNGKLQVTYANRPLYYYVDDSPGTILCHNVDEFGGLWLVVRPNGRPVP